VLKHNYCQNIRPGRDFKEQKNYCIIALFKSCDCKGQLARENLRMPDSLHWKALICTRGKELFLLPRDGSALASL